MTLAALTEAERFCWHRLAQSENVGPATFQQLLSRFGSASVALEAIPELSQRGGLRRPLRLYDEQRAVEDFAAAQKLGARFVALCEPDYPELLRQSPSPPPLICMIGDAGLLHRPALAVVGARNASAAGLRFTRMIAGELAAAGLIIVSGLARGIDTAAHEAALAHGTVAVVAGGVDHFYPPENEALQRAIAAKGVLLSEMPPGRVPKAEHFPRRNRIIAALCAGTAVVEAAMRSGSLSTARFANEAGREVFAVPGSPLDPRCEGTNGLIKDGAHMLTRAMDVLDVLRPGEKQLHFVLEEEVQAASFDAPDDVRARVLSLLSRTPVDLDDLLREAKGQPAQVMGVLLELELAGTARRHPGGKFSQNG
ncbi:MAG: DNA-processing protein DprA [Alphaproteobacteria bacterium]|nr:DNA-processing protein DprA [Alphaproteobacteria bacterium]